jgi:tetratricopeptide (TPR) repeat protein
MKIADIREAISTHIEAAEYKKALKFCELMVNHHSLELCFDDWFQKGLCHFMLDQYDDSVSCYERALAIEPSNFQAMSNIAIILLRLNRESEGFELFKKALTINRNIAPAWLHIGRYHMERSADVAGACGKAVNAFRRAINIAPHFDQTRVYFPMDDVIAPVSYILSLLGKTEEMEDNHILTIEE